MADEEKKEVVENEESVILETKEQKKKVEDEIMKGCLLTQGGKIIHEKFQ